MALNNFRSVNLKIDKANDYFISNQFAKEGDFNGRKLVVQLTNGGLIEDQTGVALNLGWQHQKVLNKGLDPFTVVDATQGVFEISYPTEMMQTGNVVAVIQVIESGKIVETRNFTIQIEASPIDEDTIVSENSFTVLQNALLTVNKYDGRISNLENTKATKEEVANFESEVAAQFAQTMTQTEFDSWVATLLDGGPSIFMDSLAALNLTYPTGASGVALVRETDPAKIYVWNGTGWQLFGDYQGLEIKDDSVTTGKISDKNVTMNKTDFIIPSENLFNFADIKNSGYYANNGDFIVNATFGSTGFIEVGGGKIYQTDIGLINDYYGDVVFWKDKQTIVSSINSGMWSTSISTPANTKYVTIPLLKSKDSKFAMFVEGSDLPQAFVPYQGRLSDKIKVAGSSLIDLNLGYDELEFIQIDENLFDKDNPIVGGYYDANGNWGSTELYNSSNFMKVKAGVSYYADFPNFYEVCFFDEFKRPVKGVGIQAGSWVNIISVPYVKQIKYMTIPYSTSYTEGDIQVRTGTSAPLDFMEYGHKYISFKDGTINSKSLGSLTGDKITKDMDMLVFGDSVSETATMNDDGTNYDEGGTGNNLSNWPTYATEILETASLVNYAKSGARYKDTSTSDLRVKLSHQISTAIARGTTADIIIVSAGTNDGIENLGDFSTAMAKTSLESLDRLKLYEAVRWAFWTLRLNYPGAQFFAALPIQRADQETPKELIDCIVKMANRYNFYVIDANSESGIVRDFENISAEGRDLADGLHPNTKGKLKMGLLYARDILRAIQQDVSSTSMDVAEVADARGDYDTLGDRLAQEEQKVTNQLEQKATKGEIGITDLDKNKIQFDETWLADSLKQQILGNTPLSTVPADKSITRIKLADKAVSSEQTNFIKGGSDIFNQSAITADKGVSVSNGALVNFTGVSVFSGQVLENTTYEIAKSLGSKTIGTAFYNESGSFISAVYPPDTTQNSLTYQVKTPMGTKTMKTSMLSSDVPTQKILELKYKLDKTVVEIDDGAVKKESLSSIETIDYNLYKKSDVVLGSYIGATGLPTVQANTSYVKIALGDKTEVSILRGSQVYTSATGSIGFLDSVGNLISYIVPSTQYLNSEKYNDKLFLTVPVPLNARFLQMTTKAGYGNDEDTLIVSNGRSIRETILKSLFGIYLDTVPQDLKNRALEGKKSVSFGDSITWYDGKVFSTTHIQSGTQAKGYQSYMREYLGCSVDNQGESGWDIRQILTKIQSYNYTDKDFATLTSGANDHRIGVPIGTLQPIGSAFDITTFTGALQKAVEHILTQKPNIKLYLITPIKGWYHESGTTDVPNTASDTIGVMSANIPNAIKAVGNLYSLPVCDLYNLSGINELTKDSVPLIGDNNAVFTAYDLHPTNSGYKQMADIIIPFFKTNNNG